MEHLRLMEGVSAQFYSTATPHGCLLSMLKTPLRLGLCMLYDKIKPSSDFTVTYYVSNIYSWPLKNTS